MYASCLGGYWRALALIVKTSCCQQLLRSQFNEYRHAYSRNSLFHYLVTFMDVSTAENILKMNLLHVLSLSLSLSLSLLEKTVTSPLPVAIVFFRLASSRLKTRSRDGMPHNFVLSTYIPHKTCKF